MPITVQNNRAMRLDARSVSHRLRHWPAPALRHIIAATTQLHPLSPVPGGEAVIIFRLGHTPTVAALNGARLRDISAEEASADVRLR
jgi:hypothetical protein